MTTDIHGNLITGASEKAADLYGKATQEFALYVGDPIATLAEAVEDSPGCAMAHLANAHLHLAGSDKPGVEVAVAALDAVSGLMLCDREQAHAASVRAFVEGDFERGHERLEKIVLDHPRDLVAVQTAHLWDFLLGDARRLRERIAMVLPHWTPSDRDYHALHGMHAFGLEECGLYEQAEEAGRMAVNLNPRDSWAQHAVAHVLEMQGRVDDGIAWMRGNQDGWAPENFFAVHNWWHLALYHLDRGEMDEVLELYDGPIRQDRSTVMLDMVDASAMLWRLYLRGVDVADRVSALAEDWAPFAEDGYYAFNDAHAVMAFVAAGRDAEADRTLATMESQVGGGGTNAMMTEQVGLPVARAFRAFGHGDYAAVVEHLRPVRSIANRFGGSHAQRDIIDLTLIEAAIRGGDTATARAFTAERLARKPTSPLGALLARRAEDMAEIGTLQMSGSKIETGTAVGPVTIRPAVREDSAAIAELFLISSDGLAEYIWSGIDAPGRSLLEIGAQRYAREGVAFSYRNCRMATIGDAIAGMVHSFEMPESDGVETDPVLRPYAELEDPGSLYISGIAVHPDHRNAGIGTLLLGAAHDEARRLGLPRVSLICFEQNAGAMRLYRRHGYEEVDRRPLVPHPTLHYTDGNAILLIKPV